VLCCDAGDWEGLVEVVGVLTGDTIIRGRVALDARRGVEAALGCAHRLRREFDRWVTEEGV
jgi:hypothetical protein